MCILIARSVNPNEAKREKPYFAYSETEIIAFISDVSHLRENWCVIERVGQTQTIMKRFGSTIAGRCVYFICKLPYSSQESNMSQSPNHPNALHSSIEN